MGRNMPIINIDLKDLIKIMLNERFSLVGAGNPRDEFRDEFKKEFAYEMIKEMKKGKNNSKEEDRGTSTEDTDSGGNKRKEKCLLFCDDYKKRKEKNWNFKIENIEKFIKQEVEKRKEEINKKKAEFIEKNMNKLDGRKIFEEDENENKLEEDIDLTISCRLLGKKK